MLIVNVFPDTVSRHLSHVMTALSDLAANGSIKLYYKTKFKSGAIQAKNNSVIYFEVINTELNQLKKVCVDMLDAGDKVFEDRLESCDIYFKRSYNSAILSNLVTDTALRNKIKPYGLYFACKSINYYHEYEFLFKYILVNNKKFLATLAGLKKIINLYKNSIKSSLYKLGFSKSYSYLVDPQIFESKPDNGYSGQVMYFTRIWDLDEIKENDKDHVRYLNESRISLVSYLKQELGDKFTGGIMESAYSIEQCPELVVPLAICTRENYLKIVQNAAICIATTGLHGSIGAKLPEYLAAAKCIVSEPLNYELPEPLLEGVNIHYFSSNQDCISLCRQLLEDGAKVIEMKNNNHDFYEKKARPMVQLKNRLDELFN